MPPTCFVSFLLFGGRLTCHCDLGSPEYQAWLLNALDQFYTLFGDYCGGFSFDGVFLGEAHKHTMYAQWRGWANVLEGLKRLHPDIVIDNRLSAHALGAWHMLAGSYDEVGFGISCAAWCSSACPHNGHSPRALAPIRADKPLQRCAPRARTQSPNLGTCSPDAASASLLLSLTWRIALCLPLSITHVHTFWQPIAGDENPETYGIPVPSVRTDHVAADNLRRVNYWYRQGSLLPMARIPGKSSVPGASLDSVVVETAGLAAC